MVAHREYAAISTGLVIVTFLIAYPFSFVTYPHRDYRCIDYLGAGTLYGGQPECVQPPMIYALGVLLPGDVQLSFWFVMLLAHFVAVFAMLSLAAQDDRLISIALALGYCLTVLSATKGQPETALAMAFVMLSAWLALRKNMPLRILKKCSSKANLTDRFNGADRSEHLKIPFFLLAANMMYVVVRR